MSDRLKELLDSIEDIERTCGFESGDECLFEALAEEWRKVRSNPIHFSTTA